MITSVSFHSTNCSRSHEAIWRPHQRINSSLNQCNVNYLESKMYKNFLMWNCNCNRIQFIKISCHSRDDINNNFEKYVCVTNSLHCFEIVKLNPKTNYHAIGIIFTIEINALMLQILYIVQNFKMILKKTLERLCIK